MSLVRRVFGILVLSTLTAVCANAAITPATPSAVNGCYQIGSAAELYGFAAIVNSGEGSASYCAKLTADITVNTGVLNSNGNKGSGTYESWTPIGNSNHPFSGVFDGQAHSISGLFFNDNSTSSVGLFGYVIDNTEIKNVGIEDSYFLGNSSVGTFVGNAGNVDNLKFLNCYSRSYVEGYSNYVGGFVGYGYYGYISIKNSFFAGKLSGSHYYMGSFIGRPYWFDFANAYFLDGQVGYYTYGNRTSVDDFNDGTVAASLFRGLEGNIWRQGEDDAYPSFKGRMVKGVDVCYLENYENSESVIDCSIETLPRISREGYKFDGWFLTANYEGSALESVPAVMNAGTSLYAKWTQLTQLEAANDGCYYIDSKESLYSFAAIVNGTYAENRAAEPTACGKLSANIAVNSDVLVDGALNENHSGFERWIPIGNDEAPFGGTFDGQGHTISGLYINDESLEGVGLFGIAMGATQTVTIRNVGIKDSYIKGKYHVGGILGFAKNCPMLSMENVYNAAMIEGIGGISGLVGGVSNDSQVTITNAYNIGSIFSEWRVGDIIGSYDESNVKVDKAYYLGRENGVFGMAVSEDDFNDGLVAFSLHNGLNGSIWGQDADGGVKYPDFSGSVVGNAIVPKSVILHYGDNDEVTFNYVESFNQLPVPTREDGVFIGWFESADFSGSAVTEVPQNATENTTLYANWLGLENGCYQIASASGLKTFADIVNGFNGNEANPYACGKLVDNITLNSGVLDANGDLKNGNFEEWQPIGIDLGSGGYHPFKGVFDGQGHTISGLYMNSPYEDYIGFFGYVSENAVIENVGLVDMFIRGDDNVGGFIGIITNGSKVSIQNCFVVGSLNGDEYVGGFVGLSDYGNLNVQNSYAMGTLNAVSYGDLIGKIDYNSTINVDNFFCNLSFNGNYRLYDYGISPGEEYFADGTIASYLRYYGKNGVTGNYWGQNVIEHDPYPNFSGVLNGAANVPTITLHFNDDSTFVLAYMPGGETRLPSTMGADYYVEGWYENNSYTGSKTKFLDEDASGNYEFWAKLGETHGCVTISDADELYEFSERVNDGENTLCGLLVDDIVFNENVIQKFNQGITSNLRSWFPIGTEYYPFVGTFDGNGHTVSGLYYNAGGGSGSYGEDYKGLFGRVGSDDGDSVVIKNLGIVDSYISGGYYIGSFVGYVHEGTALTIVNSFATGLVSAGGCYGSGFVGQTKGRVRIYNSYSTGFYGTCWSDAFVASTGNDGSVDGYDNNFYLDYNEYGYGIKNTSKYGESVEALAFNIGAIAKKLHDYSENGVDGSIWGQLIGESWPNFGGVVEIPEQKTVTLHSFESEEPFDYYENLRKLPKYVETGYIFAGWYDNENYSGNAYSEVPDGAENLYAKWFKIVRPELVDNCYQITTANELYGFAAIVNGTPAFDGDAVETNDPDVEVCGTLMNNIVVNQNVLTANDSVGENAGSFIPWNPIGRSHDDDDDNWVESYFAGTFDGQGNTVSGLYYDDSEEEYVGFFGNAKGGEGKSVVIENVGIVDSYLRGFNYVGALIGSAANGVTVVNVYNLSSINGASQVGGIVGYVRADSRNYTFRITNSFNEGKVSAYPNWGTKVGGLIGEIDGANVSVTNVYNSGFVGVYNTPNQNEDYAGGIIGLSDNGDYRYNVSIRNSYSVGGVQGYHKDAFGIGRYYDFGTVNNYFLSGLNSSYGTEASISQFRDGTVATALHNYSENGLDASIWGQNVGEDEFPNFSGSVTGVPYENCVAIADEDDLFDFATRVNGGETTICAKLVADVFVENTWTPIGTTQHPFTGSFHGMGHALDQLGYEGKRGEEIGIKGVFGVVAGDSVTIDNLNLSVYFEELCDPSESSIGGLVGFAKPSANLTIANVRLRGNVQGRMTPNLGGFVGYVDGGTVNIYNSYIVGSVIGKYAKAIVGGWRNGSTINSENNYAFDYIVKRVSGDEEKHLVDLATPVSADVIQSGAVAVLLHNYNENGVDGSIWGQTSFDNWYNDGDGPDFSGRIAQSPNFAVLHFNGREEIFAYDDDRTLPDLRLLGVIFTGWYLNADFSGNPITEIPAGFASGGHIYGNRFEKLPQVVDGCYQIGAADELYGFAAIVNGTMNGDVNALEPICGKLTADIAVNQNVLKADGSLSDDAENFVQWTPIGADEYAPFGGSFDGDGNTISGLYINDENKTGGFIGYTYGDDAAVEIKNVRIVDSYVKMGWGTGCLIGEVDSETEIKNSYTRCTVEGSGAVGGFVGAVWDESLTIDESSTESIVRGAEDSEGVGGFVGEAYGGTTINITNSFSKAIVSGDWYVGGLVGYAMETLNVTNSYSVAVVSGSGNVGALVGSDDDGYANVNSTNFFYLNNVECGDESTILTYGTLVTAEDFANGSVAALLHAYNADGVDGSIWGQDVVTDAYPNFSGSVGHVIVLDWNTSEDIVVLADSNTAIATEIRIADGKQFYANGVIYSGVLSAAQIAAIGNNTLYPISGVVAVGSGTATLDGDNVELLVIPEVLRPSSVTLNRTFTENVNSTIVLPFSATVSADVADFATFNGVLYNDAEQKWEAHWMPAAIVDGVIQLEANTPYLVIPKASVTDVSLANVQFPESWVATPSARVGNWVFNGTYDYKKWLAGDAELGKAYGFASSTKDVNGKTVQAGAFVKAAANAKVRPMRDYLLYSPVQNSRPCAAGVMCAPAQTIATDSLPKTIYIRLLERPAADTSATVVSHSGDENTEVKTGEKTDDKTVAQTDTKSDSGKSDSGKSDSGKSGSTKTDTKSKDSKSKTEDPTALYGNDLLKVKASDDVWYDMRGRRLQGKPTAKGTYYNNGRTVIVK